MVSAIPGLFGGQYQVAGQVSREFMECWKKYPAIMGPVGSGKTSTCVNKVALHSMLQQPSPIDGVRYSKWAFIRDTHVQLDKTTIKTWLDWFPKAIGAWSGGPPASHIIDMPHPDGVTRIHLEIEFQGIGDQNPEQIARGWELTGAWMNEADLMDEAVFRAVSDRLGRYPKKMHGGPSWYGMICDLNAPFNDNWTFTRWVEKSLPGHAFFEQPPGMLELEDGTYILNPDAENIENLPDDYYTAKIEEYEADPEILDVEAHAGRMILNRPGFPPVGKPVFKNYRDKTHYVDHELKPIAGIPIHIGLDGGRTPAAILLQNLGDGRWLALREIILDGAIADDMGEEINRVLYDHYRDWSPKANGRSARKLLRGWGDPAADNDNDTSDDTFLDIVTRVTNILFQPAPGDNNITVRLGAVNGCLKRSVRGQPGLLLGKNCPELRKGFMGGYHVQRIKSGGSVRYATKPMKNGYSHPHDGLQYGLLGGGEYRNVRHLHGSSKNNKPPDRRGSEVERAIMTNRGIGNTR